MKENFIFKSFAAMLAALPTDESCRQYFEQIRWNNIPVCPHCNITDENHYKLKTKGEFHGLYKCRNCKERFTVTIGTIFEGSHIPMRKWFIAIYMFQSHKKGVSSHQLAKDLGITQKSSWFMLSRIRSVFGADKPIDLGDNIQVDETFVGGKNKNRHWDKKVEQSQGRSFKDKTPVFGAISSTGIVYTAVIPNTKAATIKPIIYNMVKEGSIVVSDEWHAYTGLAKDYKHVIVNHKAHQYVNNAGFTTNSIENFWSHLKRGIYGIYHQVRPKHLQRYCDEFAFRFNARKIDDYQRFDYALKKTIGIRLTYNLLTK